MSDIVTHHDLRLGDVVFASDGGTLKAGALSFVGAFLGRLDRGDVILADLGDCAKRMIEQDFDRATAIETHFFSVTTANLPVYTFRKLGHIDLEASLTKLPT